MVYCTGISISKSLRPRREQRREHRRENRRENTEERIQKKTKAEETKKNRDEKQTKTGMVIMFVCHVSLRLKAAK